MIEKSISQIYTSICNGFETFHDDHSVYEI